MSYQWFFNVGELPGETSSSVRFNQALTNQHGIYTVQISDNGGSIMTDPVSLTVLVPPVLQQQPQDVSVSPGGTAAFSVTATGVEPLQYLWLHNGRPIRNATNSLLEMSN